MCMLRQVYVHADRFLSYRWSYRLWSNYYLVVDIIMHGNNYKVKIVVKVVSFTS